MIDFSKFESILSIMSYFTSEAVCKQTIIESRWSTDNGIDVVCPYCGRHHCKALKNGRFECKHCGNKFSCLVGTIFENTKIQLVKWFVAMYLLSSNKKGVSSCQLSRDINVTQKTAWFMLQKIRTLFVQNDSEKLSGDIELDEVYIGGKERLKHQNKRIEGTQGRSTKTKTPVFGIMKRGKNDSKVHAVVVGKTDKQTLLPIIQHFCESGSKLFTDELASYNPLENMGYVHRVINHGVNEFVNGDIYTNNIEGFWNHLRRMISGTYHHMSVKYLQRYVDEAVYRWNTRKLAESERVIDLFSKSINKADYNVITMKMTA